MLLQFENQDPFSTGISPFTFRPATATEKYNRIVIMLQLGGINTDAFLDTGGVYAVCSPEIGRYLNLHPEDGDPESIRTGRGKLNGSLHRIPITFLAETGENLTIEATAFIPSLQPNEEWEQDFPCVLGLHGCLERLRFAIDPLNEEFHFGEPYPQNG